MLFLPELEWVKAPAGDDDGGRFLMVLLEFGLAHIVERNAIHTIAPANTIVTPGVEEILPGLS